MYCAYGKGQTVLSIPHVNLYRGRITCMLGASGIGKSTFIEALGLMNDTILSGADTSVRFFPGGEASPIELSGAWQTGNAFLSAFRNQYYSFIFQQTNLMPNFTAGENMCISKLIGGQSLAVARKEVTVTMEALQLEEALFDRPTMHLSGGQRQRVAFVRAITADFEVLFGDEPTGNLDRATATRLMQVLQLSLKESSRTAIIVTHDVELAFRFADQLLILTPKPGQGCGQLLPEHVLHRTPEGWTDHRHQILGAPAQFVNNLLSPPKMEGYV